MTLAFNRARVLEAGGSAQAAAREYEGILQVCAAWPCSAVLQLRQLLSSERVAAYQTPLQHDML